MRTMSLIFLGLISFQLAFSAERTEVKITGRFLGELPKEIIYTYPVNGTSFEGFFDKVELDSLGNFQIVLNIDRPVLLNFMYIGSPSLIIEPGNNYEILLSLNKDNILEISGDICETQKVYSSFPHQHPIYCRFAFGENFTDYHPIVLNLNNDLQKELSILNELYNQNKISEILLNLLATDRKIYYYSAQMVLASRNHLEKISNNKEVPDDIFNIWKEAANGVPWDNEFILSSFYSFSFLEMHLWHRIYTTFDFDDFVKLRAEKRNNQSIHTHNIELAKAFFPNGILEFYIAGLFHHQNMRRQYDKNLDAIFEQFKKDFPESNYLPFVEKTFQNMIEKQQELVLTK